MLEVELDEKNSCMCVFAALMGLFSQAQSLSASAAWVGFDCALELVPVSGQQI